MKHKVQIVIPKAFDLICVWIVPYKKISKQVCYEIIEPYGISGNSSISIHFFPEY